MVIVAVLCQYVITNLQKGEEGGRKATQKSIFVQGILYRYPQMCFERGFAIQAVSRVWMNNQYRIQSPRTIYISAAQRANREIQQKHHIPSEKPILLGEFGIDLSLCSPMQIELNQCLRIAHLHRKEPHRPYHLVDLNSKSPNLETAGWDSGYSVSFTPIKSPVRTRHWSVDFLIFSFLSFFMYPENDQQFLSVSMVLILIPSQCRRAEGKDRKDAWRM